MVGQTIRAYTKFRGHGIPLSGIGQCSLLFIIYSTFCDTFISPELGITAVDVLVTVLLVLFLQVLMTTVCYLVTSSFPRFFTPADTVAVLFCSTHKSLTLGIPILRIMFHGYSHLSQISLPLLVYHPAQIILGGLMTTQLKDWVHDRKHKRLPV